MADHGSTAATTRARDRLEVSAPPRPSLTGELLAEFAGTAILILFGVGVVAQVVAGENGGADSIHWAWGLGVTLGVYVAGRTSGAHLNPAVTIALATFKGFSWAKVVPYSIAQFLGAFAAALVVRWTYNDLIIAADPGTTYATQGIFSTLPNESIGLGDAFLDQVVGTAILVFVIFAITEARATPPGVNLAPFIIGLLVVGIGMAWGVNAGYAINPARDFGPRLASFLTGYDTAMREPGGAFYFWIPIVAPIVGALLGGGRYKVLVERYLPAAPGEPTEPGRIRSDA